MDVSNFIRFNLQPINTMINHFILLYDEFIIDFNNSIRFNVHSIHFIDAMGFG